MFSCKIYCHTSISVQLLMGKTRKCSPSCFLPLKMFHNSGRWFLGSHCPNSSRCEKKRSLARAFSSSRRAPPNAASNLCCSSVSSNVTVCSLLRLAVYPFSSTARPVFIDSSTEPTIKSAPNSSTNSSRYVMVSSKLCPVSICTNGNGMAAG